MSYNMLCICSALRERGIVSLRTFRVEFDHRIVLNSELGKRYFVFKWTKAIVSNFYGFFQTNIWCHWYQMQLAFRVKVIRSLENVSMRSSSVDSLQAVATAWLIDKTFWYIYIYTYIMITLYRKVTWTVSWWLCCCIFSLWFLQQNVVNNCTLV